MRVFKVPVHFWNAEPSHSFPEVETYDLLTKVSGFFTAKPGLHLLIFNVQSFVRFYWRWGLNFFFKDKQ
jgi:hypothetical protein